MYYIAILDDDKNFGNQLAGNIKTQWKEVHVEVYTDYRNLYIKNLHAIFIDIEFDNMPKNGFQIANEIKELNRDIFVIFVSSHSKYAFDGYKYTPFRFLNKKEMQDQLKEAMTALIDTLDQNNKKINLIDIYGEHVLVPINNIIYAYKEGNYMIIQAHEQYKIRTSTKGLLMQLSDKFFSPSRGEIINLKYLTKYDLAHSILILENDKKFILSREHKKDFIKILSDGNLL